LKDLYKKTSYKGDKPSNNVPETKTNNRPHAL